MINPGTILQKRYRVQKKIGQGGMGAVYVATDERFGSTVAIKETLFSDPSFGKAFEREARLLNNLRHPALPRVSDHFSDENGQFLVMEYITGEDLSEMMEKKHGAFSVNEVLDWADQLLDALDFLHTQEVPVIHRDIKPQNLKLTPRGQIILLDFGLAKGNPTDAQNQTAAKSVFGFSRNYASVEQIQGTGTDPRSDLYSLAATLYHLLTGTAPVDALTRAMQVLNGEADPLMPADEVNNQVPAGVADVLLRAMNLNSNNRPTSAMAMRSMLSESDRAGSDAILKPVATDILTQQTQVFADSAKAQTLKLGGQTEILPIENSGAFRATSERETAVRQNIVPANSKRGMAFGATALGGIALASVALGGFYFLRTPAANNVVANTSIAAPVNAAETPANAVLAANQLSSVNTNSAVNTSATAPVKKDVTSRTPDKPVDKAAVSNPKPPTAESAQSNPAQPAMPAQPAKPAQSATEKSGSRVVVDDGEGTQILADGTVKANDGTVVYPNGRIVKDGKVIVEPPAGRNRTDKMSPQRRRQMRKIIENAKGLGIPTPTP